MERVIFQTSTIIKLLLFIYLLLMLLLIPIYSLFQLIHVDEIQLAVEL